ncbi:unnamed protein product [Clonostachys rosea]|uniref:HMA domain-containing protein n=1 Tax=Bionectria ochroleuca TaxID=29856 RepID=A0ABY6V469_BIOOC|nr:unnamed protein product [Clonostachys rosea]
MEKELLVHDSCDHKHEDHHHHHGHDNDHHNHSHDDDGHAKSRSHSHGGSCCSDKTTAVQFNEEIDMEKAVDHEIVSVAIAGMDCTSCSDKLSRILVAIPGVSQARVNFIAGRADFTIDTKLTTADQVVRSAASGSGFRLTRILGGEFFIDVHVDPQNGKTLAREPPQGVVDVHVLDKKTLRLVYDPRVVGARDLFNSISANTQGLAPPRPDSQLETTRRRLMDQSIKTALAAIFTIPVLILSWRHGLVEERKKAIISFVLGSVVQAIAVPEFYRPALSSLFYSRVVEMDMLVVISITAAYVYSVVAFGFNMSGKSLGSDLFETSTLLITLILLGRLIATVARVRAISAVSVRSMQPNKAILVEKGRDSEVDARLLQYGDQFRLLPHSQVPTDGTVLEGSTEIDESMLTGEPIPVLKQTGDSVIAGTVNGDGTVLVQLDRLPGKNTVTDIAQLVDEAANSKPKIQDLANKIAGWFVPAVSSIAVIVLAVWLGIGVKLFYHTPGEAVLEAVTYFVATLAVACPCALGLAVPMVLVVAGGIAARGGVVIKSAETTERARKATDIIFDKTGTITECELEVVEERYLAGDTDYATALALAIVDNGRHPVSAGVAKHLQARINEKNSTSPPELSNIRTIPGAGIEARLDNKLVRAGNARWTGTDSHPEIQSLERDGLTTFVVTVELEPLVVFGLRTQIRPEACRVISQLVARGLNVHLVSGDQKLAVKSVATTVGIPEGNVAAECTPNQKRDYVASIMQDSSRYVVFCGDGTNDAIAVAQAHVGIQVGGSLTTSEVTQTAADVVILNGLEGVLFLLNVSKVAFRRMIFNFVWSAIYNVFAITMASGAWVKFRIPPAYAGLGEFVSVLPVIAASVSMLFLNLKPVASGRRGN